MEIIGIDDIVDADFTKALEGGRGPHEWIGCTLIT